MDKGAFYLGSIAPDAMSFKPGCKRSDKKYSHFCLSGDEWGVESNNDEWRENLTVSLKRYEGHVNKDFLYGYYAHGIADIETSRLFHGPVRDQRNDALMEAYIRDCSAAEAVLLRNMGNLDDLWTLLYQSNHHCLHGLFSCQDMSTMIDFMEHQLYANMPVNPEYRASVYGIHDFTEFIANTIKTIDVLSWFD